MKIAVLVKEVPDLEARVTVVGGGKALDVEKKRCLNFFDEIAVEGALRLKAANPGSTVYAVAAGAQVGVDAARRALAMGADAVFHIDDPALADADPLTVAEALAALVRREGFDVVLAGRQATDDEAGLVGPLVAQLLSIPCVAGITSLSVESGSALATRETDEGSQTVRVALPALFSAEKGLYEPRVPQVMGLMKAMRTPVPKVSLATLGVTPRPPLAPSSFRGPTPRPKTRFIEGDPEAAAATLVRLLKEEAKVL